MSIRAELLQLKSVAVEILATLSLVFSGVAYAGFEPRAGCALGGLLAAVAAWLIHKAAEDSLSPGKLALAIFAGVVLGWLSPLIALAVAVYFGWTEPTVTFEVWVGAGFLAGMFWAAGGLALLFKLQQSAARRGALILQHEMDKRLGRDPDKTPLPSENKTGNV